MDPSRPLTLVPAFGGASFFFISFSTRFLSRSASFALSWASFASALSFSRSALASCFALSLTALFSALSFSRSTFLAALASSFFLFSRALLGHFGLKCPCSPQQPQGLGIYGRTVLLFLSRLVVFHHRKNRKGNQFFCSAVFS